MNEMYPARLTIPIPGTSNGTFEFTCENDTKVTDFTKTVLDNIDKNVTKFELLDGKKQAFAETAVLGDVKSSKFHMKVN